MKIRAAWSRTIQVKPYESERLELAIEDDGFEPPTDKTGAAFALKETAALSRQLSALGDELIAERLRAHAPKPPVALSHLPAEPDPWLSKLPSR